MFNLSVTLLKVGTPSICIDHEWNSPNSQLAENILHSCYWLGFVMEY